MNTLVAQNFVQQAIKEGLRIGSSRDLNDIRKIKIQLGPELGTCLVQLGKTRVLANVSCEIVRPSSSSPAEGSILINTEYSQMGAPANEGDRKSEEEVILSRMLEKTLRKARAIDTEGLCIVAGEKVWSIRVDVRVLDQDGNILDCASIATISALLHFKRPDITVQGHDVVIVRFRFLFHSTLSTKNHQFHYLFITFH